MEEKEVYNIIPKDGVTVIEIRKGDALPLKEPVKMVILGQITAPALFIQQRGELINPAESIIVVNRAEMKIALETNPKDAYGTLITGKLELSKEFKMFGINTNTEFNTYELADLLKMNRFCFEKPTEAMKLVTTLQQFEAKVNTEISEKDDKKGNTERLRRQAVSSNLPDSFVMNIPLFKGGAKTKMVVEIDINPKNLNCTLVSPDAKELMDNCKDAIIDEQLTRMQGFCIIEQ